MSGALEMAVLSSVTHPNIVQVYSCMTDMVEVEGAFAPLLPAPSRRLLGLARRVLRSRSWAQGRPSPWPARQPRAPAPHPPTAAQTPAAARTRCATAA
jgi:hypothetical protein